MLSVLRKKKKKSLKLTSKKRRMEGGRGERQEGGNEEIRKNIFSFEISRTTKCFGYVLFSFTKVLQLRPENSKERCTAWASLHIRETLSCFGLVD